MPSALTPKELALIQNLESVQNQRGLARVTGFSLGMTNLLLKRLVKKGYVKVVTLNGRTLRYMLTPTGFAEKVRRSYDFITGSIRYIAQTRARIRSFVPSEYKDTVYLFGSGELASLAAEVLREQGLTAEPIEDLAGLPENCLCLLCEPEVPAFEPSPGQSIRTILT